MPTKSIQDLSTNCMKQTLNGMKETDLTPRWVETEWACTRKVTKRKQKSVFSFVFAAKCVSYSHCRTGKLGMNNLLKKHQM